MSFAMFAQIAGTGLKFASALKAGSAARDSAAFDAYQTKLQRQNNKLQASEKANLRRSRFDTAQSTNNAFFSFLGRDTSSDQSYKAFLKKQKAVLAEDISAIEADAFIQDTQLKAQSDQRTYEGAIADRDYKTQALSSLATGMYQYNVSKS